MATFTKEERLCSKKLIAELFSRNNTIQVSHYPILATWKSVDLPLSMYPAQVLFSIPKKKFKKAHDRNLLKRQLKECYRNQKTVFYDILSVKHLQYAIVMVYIAQEKLSFQKIENACSAVLKSIAGPSQ